MNLAKAGKAPLLVVTNSWMPWWPNSTPEGDVLAARAEAHGVSRDVIRVTKRAANTAEEAKTVAEVLGRPPDGSVGNRIILVTSAFHMRRAELLFTRAGFEVLPFPVDFRSSGPSVTLLDILPTATDLYHTEIALREFYGYAYYATLGR